MSKLGGLLVREGLLTESDRRTIHRESGTHRGSFARSIIALGVVDEQELAALFAAKTSYRIASKNLAGDIEPNALGLIPAHVLMWLDVIPIKVVNGVLHVAMTDPTDREAIAQLEFFSGLIIKPVIASFSAIHGALREHMSSHVDFGRSEFEDFLKNHSVNASKFASLDVTPKKQKAAPKASSFDEDDDSIGGSVPVEEDDGEEISFDAAPPAMASAPSVAEAVAMAEEDTSVVFDDDAPAPAAGGESLSAPHDMNVESVEQSEQLAVSDSLDLDLGDEALERSSDEDGDDALTTAASAEAVSASAADAVPMAANMDDMLAGESGGESLMAEPLEADDAIASTDIDFGDEVESLADIPAEPLGDTESLGEDVVASANDELSLEQDSLSLDAADFSSEPATQAADIGAESVQASDDMSLEIDPAADLSSLETEGIKPGLDGEDLMLPDDISPNFDETPTVEAGGRDLVDLEDMDLAAEATPVEASLEFSEPTDLTESVDVSGAADVSATLDTADTLAGIELADMDLGLEEPVKAEVPVDLASAELAPADDELNIGDDIFGDISSEGAEPSIGDFDVASDNHGSLDVLAGVDVGTAPTIEPIADDTLAATAHAGIANVNRALVNIALLSDSTKALTRMANAAGQVGVDSGALVMFEQNTIKPGVLWNRSAGELGVIADSPAGLTVDIAKVVVAAAAGKEEWLALDQVLGPQATVFAASWPTVGQAPTHVLVKKRADGCVMIGLARFDGDINHDGLRQSFAELVKAAGAKMS